MIEESWYALFIAQVELGVGISAALAGDEPATTVHIRIALISPVTPSACNRSFAAILCSELR